MPSYNKIKQKEGLHYLRMKIVHLHLVSSQAWGRDNSIQMRKYRGDV